MANISCPHCGSPITVRGNRWECGWCGDFGALSSLRPEERAKLIRARDRSQRLELHVSASDAPPSGTEKAGSPEHTV